MRILYLDIDSLTPSHLHCYGYRRRTSPTIDAIAAEGVRFTNVYCSDAPCMPSRTALYSGRFGILTGAVGHGGSTAERRVEGRDRDWRGQLEYDCLVQQFRNRGMHTAMISPFGERHGAYWIYAGFNEIHNPGNLGWESAEEVQPMVDDWLTRNAAKDNWYLHVNFWDPHTEYRVPMEYGNPFAREPVESWFTPELIARQMRQTGPHTPLDLGMYCSQWQNVARCMGLDPKSTAGIAAARKKYPRIPDAITDGATLKQWLDAYDTAIHYVDHHIAKVVAALKKADVYDDTAIVISADHGENQGELAIYGEHATADQGTCNIPLIIKWPGGARGTVDRDLHYNLDLAPTYVSLLDGKPPASWSGQSFAHAVKSTAAEPTPPREDLIISQCTHVCQRSVRFGPWLYIRTYHDGFHSFGPEMLFNIETDPHEINDVSRLHPDICREAASRLLHWHDAQMRTLADTGAMPTDPMWTVIAEGGPALAQHRPGRSPLPAYLNHLRETGRADGAESLQRRYPEACGR